MRWYLCGIRRLDRHGSVAGMGSFDPGRKVILYHFFNPLSFPDDHSCDAENVTVEARLKPRLSGLRHSRGG